MMAVFPQLDPSQGPGGAHASCLTWTFEWNRTNECDDACVISFVTCQTVRRDKGLSCRSLVSVQLDVAPGVRLTVQSLSDTLISFIFDFVKVFDAVLFLVLFPLSLLAL